MDSLFSYLFLSRRNQCLAAALMWTLVGLMLVIRGTSFLISDADYFLLLVTFILGIVKFFTVFRNTAYKNVSRINNLEKDVIIFSVFPLRTWILIAFMIILGVSLRLSPLPRTIYSLLIAGVGLGMSMGSAIFWKAWMG